MDLRKIVDIYLEYLGIDSYESYVDISNSIKNFKKYTGRSGIFRKVSTNEQPGMIKFVDNGEWMICDTSFIKNYKHIIPLHLFCDKIHHYDILFKNATRRVGFVFYSDRKNTYIITKKFEVCKIQTSKIHSMKISYLSLNLDYINTL